MIYFIVVLIAIVGFLLVLVVLIQNPKGGGVDANFGGQAAPSAPTAGGSGSADGFMNIPDGLEEELPFS